MSPRELIEDALHRLIEPTCDYSFMAPDVLIESPFGQPSSYPDRAAFLDATRESRASFPVRFDELRDLVVYQTTDPEVVIAEYTIAGTVLTSGHSTSAPFVLVARIRDGLVTHWREYQDKAAIAAALRA